jgi:hypothetical protein
MGMFRTRTKNRARRVGRRPMRNNVLAPTVLFAALFVGCVSAKLPPVTDEAKARAAESAAKGAWTDKLGAYQLCRAQDRSAEAYRSRLKAAGKDIPPIVATAPCSDPGPYAPPITPVTSKPLEAAGAHSPAGTATTPPSTNTPAAENSGKK